MDPRAAAAIAARGSELLLQAMPLETGRERIELGAAVAELAKFMERDDAARAAAQGLWLLITNAPRAEGFRSYDGLEFANTVAALALRVPAAKPTRLWALNRLMEDRRGDAMWGATTEDSGNRLAGLISGLTAPELAGILKWPVCVGDAERIVLRELEQQTGRKFDGDVWKFAAQAGSLGITDLEGPAERPRAEAALQELKSYLPVPP
jgi:hypothetical protein